MKKFFKGIISDPAFIVLAILLCLQIDWEWTNIKSFLTGGVIVWGTMIRVMK